MNMEKNALISVIVPLYNAEQYMDQAIESILKQSYHSIEILLIDDGSTDDTLLLAEAAAQRDDRVVVIRQSNSGPGAARNKGIEKASGEFICFVDSDDVLDPAALSMLMDAMDQETDLVQCRACKVFDDGRADNDLWRTDELELSPYDAMEDYLYNPQPVIRYAVWAKLIRKSALEGISFPILNNSEDVAFTAFLIAKCRKLRYIPHVLYYNTVRDGSLTHSSINRKRLEAQITCSELIREYIRGIDSYRSLYCRADWACITTYINCAAQAKAHGVDGFSPKQMRDAVKAIHIDHSMLDMRKRVILTLFSRLPDVFIRLMRWNRQ